METTDDLQFRVDEIYQKTLMCVPESVSSIMDGVTRDFITNFITVFNGSSIGNVHLTNAADEQSRNAVEDLFREIQNDLGRARLSYADMSSMSSDVETLRMYVEGREDWGRRVQDALYNVQNNISDNDTEAKEVWQKAYDKYQSTQAFQKPTDEIYNDKKRADIREYFLKNGLLEEQINDSGITVDVLVNSAITKRPTEVEKLMTILYPIVEHAQLASHMDDCVWVAQIAKSGLIIGKSLRDRGMDIEPNGLIDHALSACRKVYNLSKSTYAFLATNLTQDSNTSLAYTADPYMKSLLYDMLSAGKISKTKDGKLQVLDNESITPDDILTLCKNVKKELFRLGPDNSAEREPVHFDESFNTNIKILKTYIDFILSEDLNPVVTKDVAAAKEARTNGKYFGRTSLKDFRKQLVGAYVLVKAVHDAFDGTIMRYEDKTVDLTEDKKIPSVNEFCEKIKEISKEFPNSDVGLNDVFNYKIMYSTGRPYFPFEFVMYEHPNLYKRLCQYRNEWMESSTAAAMDKDVRNNKQVQHIFGEFAEKFNRILHGVAQIDPRKEVLKVSTLISTSDFAKVFNVISSGIVYATQSDVNDKETEYKLWSMLKQLAEKPPETLPAVAKHEFINVSHVQEDFRFRMDLAIAAGVVSSEGLRFSGNFGTVTNGRNIQAQRTRQVMNILLKYVNGLLFTNTNAALRQIGEMKPMNMNAVLPYLRKIRDIAKEYNIAVKRSNAASLGFTCAESTQIIEAVSDYDEE